MRSLAVERPIQPLGVADFGRNAKAPKWQTNCATRYQAAVQLVLRLLLANVPGLVSTEVHAD